MPAERYIFKERDYSCVDCKVNLRKLAWDYDPAPTCDCGKTMEHGKHTANKAACVIGDDIPGGLEVRHGLVNEDGSPRTFYSKSEIRRAAAEAGLTNYVKHSPARGTDKSDKTTRWI